MHYRKIEVVGFIKLRLNNIRSITITPLNAIQLFLGTNGSGKTSLVNEITPIPAHSSNYDKGGYKYLDFVHRGKEYICKIMYGDDVTYSLKCNGVELFDGSTTKQYRELVEREFGITPYIQQILSGRVRFSRMSAPERKKWLTMLSTTDFTYALKYYSSLRVEMRDLQGAINRAKLTLTEEASNVISKQVEESLREKIKLYKSSIEDILTAKPTDTILKESLVRQITSIKGQIERTAEDLIKMAIRMSSSGLVYNKNKTWETQVREGTRTTILSEAREEVLAKLRKISDIIDTMEKTHSLSKDELSRKIAETEASISDLVKGLRLGVEGTDSRRFQNDVTHIFKVMNSALAETSPESCPEYWESDVLEESFEYDSKYHASILEAVATVKGQIDSNSSVINTMTRLKDAHQTECPNCHHKWIEGYDEKKLEDLKFQNSELAIKLEGLENTKTFITKVANVNRLVTSILNTLGGLMGEYPDYERFWSKYKPAILEKVSGGSDTLSLIWNQCLTDIDSLAKIESLKYTLTDLVQQIKLLDNMGNVDRDKVHKSFNELEAQLSSLDSRLSISKTIGANAGKAGAYAIHVSTVTDRLREQLSDLDKYESQINDSMKADYANTLIRIFRNELATVEDMVSSVDIQKAKIQQLEYQIQQQEEELELLKIAERALSPSKGYIAKGLTGFINMFFEKVNESVKSIWSYPMEILPITMEDGSNDLDYKFPVLVDDRFKVSDMRDGITSTGMCEVFDLGIRIVAMELLGMGDFPPVIDEFGSGFDDKHKRDSFRVISNLTSFSNITQIFMVSHDPKYYGSLKHVDTTLLHDGNVEVPIGIPINNATVIA